MTIPDEPVNLIGFQLVKAFAARLYQLPTEQQVPKTSFKTWSAPLAETGASESQMREVGNWFAQHHQTAPALPYVICATRELQLYGSLPAHRLAGPLERNAMAILLAAQQLGLSPDDGAQAFMLAGALTHLSVHRPIQLDRGFLTRELEGMARLADYAADEILDEIQDGKGALKELGQYLYSDRFYTPQNDA